MIFIVSLGIVNVLLFLGICECIINYNVMDFSYNEPTQPTELYEPPYLRAGYIVTITTPFE